MRSFSDIEKKLIHDINVQKTSEFLFNILDRYLVDCLVSVNSSTKAVKIIFDSATPSPNLIERIEFIQRLIISSVILVEYLDKERLAIIIQPATSPSQQLNYGQLPVNINNPISYPLPDPIISELLVKYADKHIIPSNDLMLLERNKFRFPDDLRFRSQRILTIIGIILAFLVGFAGIILNIVKLYEDQSASQQNATRSQMFNGHLTTQNPMVKSGSPVVANSVPKIGDNTISFLCRVQAETEISYEIHIDDKIVGSGGAAPNPKNKMTHILSAAPGDHVLAVTALGYETWQKTITLSERSKNGPNIVAELKKSAK